MKILLFLLLLIAGRAGICQEKNSIVGRVLNGETDAPIPNASVFITNTSKGTITKPTGEFELRGIPPGNYDLVISSVGYGTHVFSFSSDKLPLNLRVLLKPKATELESVVVEPFVKNGWAEWGQFFIANFIGTGSAAKQCKIKNYKTIRFRFSRKKNLLTAFADEPLIIENAALGYKVQYQLEEFSFNFNNKTLFYLGYNLFEDMGKKRKNIPRRYINNRRKAFHGSIMHFMRSLYNNELANEGFEVRRVIREDNLEKQRVRALMSRNAKIAQQPGRQPVRISFGSSGVMTTDSSSGSDSSAYYQSVLRQPDYKDTYGTHILTADSLVSLTTDSSRYLFFSNYLYVKYSKGMEDPDYLAYLMEHRKAYHPTSLVFLLEPSALEISKNGGYFPPQNFVSSGYWSWSEKISSMLPLDYDPNEE